MRVAIELVPTPVLSPMLVPAPAEASGTSAPTADAPLLAEWPGTTADDLVGVLADVCLAALGSWTAEVGVERPRSSAPGPAAASGARRNSKEGSCERVR